MRMLQLQETIFRERMLAHSFSFVVNFAVPSFELLQKDTVFRTDWILHQSHCRHRLHISEREARRLCEQTILTNHEALARLHIVDEEKSHRFSNLGEVFDALALFCCESSRTQMIEVAQFRSWASLLEKFETETGHMKCFAEIKAQVIDFVTSGGYQMEDRFRLEMLREYHRSTIVFNL